ncbi:MAG TPA: hypothetical protein PLI09_24285 [Candidatus Hydrogenedentes bacterium]|nr:hypothetical protein [Candidatus Hydrogenedentota bacterium]
MLNCRWTKVIEAHFDGEHPADERLNAHLANCPQCKARWAELETLRRGVTQVRRVEEIGDAQFPAFMRGILDGLEPQPRRRTNFWAVLSLTMAALVISFATFVIFFGAPGEVKATEVEQVSTDLEGAKVNAYSSGDGTTTVWVTISKDDLE